VSSQYSETLSAPTAAVSETENEDQHCVTRYHVDAALALKGAEITLLEPTANVKIVGAKGEGRAKDNGGVENGVVHTRKHLAKAAVVHRGHQNESHKNEVAPPAHVAWNVMDLHPTHTSSTSRTESPIYSTNDNVAAQPSEEESVKWEIETTLTDMEDEALDEYMEMIDETLDRYTEDKLWNGENEEYLDTTSSIRDAAVNEAQKSGFAIPIRAKNCAADERLRDGVFPHDGRQEMATIRQASFGKIPNNSTPYHCCGGQGKKESDDGGG